MKLTEKQRKFCEAYVQTGSAAEAVRLAGYNSKGENCRKLGSENLAKPNIKLYINELMKLAAEKGVASAEEVLMTLTGVMRSSDENTRDRIKAAELLGKSHLLFSDRVVQETESNITIEITGDE